MMVIFTIRTPITSTNIALRSTTRTRIVARPAIAAPGMTPLTFTAPAAATKRSRTAITSTISSMAICIILTTVTAMIMAPLRSFETRT
ncbi:hypothetical protein [Bradyrhizobium diversitatis]|uniref:Uncharacterized protein n=1 Tax=Bradyrhizobium diversitatis TaxID=2755406 RepID=A0ABS0NUR8_9BRAD|nr:hypothetical protein [Bradyrhizobium diversitatis]MBH5384754.1 hypothetical protein [Bradyrhizobium diversitatis]